MMTKETKNYVTNSKVIDGELRDRINSFLRSYGYEMSGGSIVTTQDEKIQYFIGIDKGCAATIGDLPQRLKEYLKIENLIVDGVPVH